MNGDPQVDEIWQPYVTLLRANRTVLATAPDLLASLREFVALYDGLHDVLGPAVRAKLARAAAVVAKADG